MDQRWRDHSQPRRAVARPLPYVTHVPCLIIVILQESLRTLAALPNHEHSRVRPLAIRFDPREESLCMFPPLFVTSLVHGPIASRKWQVLTGLAKLRL